MVKGNPGDPIQALVLGPSTLGINVIKQLNKNARFHITWAGKDAEATYEDLEDELNVNRVIDQEKTSNPMTINDLIEDWQPDIVFLCERGEDWDIENQVGSTNLERSMLDESLRIGDAPIVTVSVEQGQKGSAGM